MTAVFMYSSFLSCDHLSQSPGPGGPPLAAGAALAEALAAGAALSTGAALAAGAEAAGSAVGAGGATGGGGSAPPPDGVAGEDDCTERGGCESGSHWMSLDAPMALSLPKNQEPGRRKREERSHVCAHAHGRLGRLTWTGSGYPAEPPLSLGCTPLSGRIQARGLEMGEGARTRPLDASASSGERDREHHAHPADGR